MNREVKFRLIRNGKVVGYEHLTEDGWKWNWIELNPDKGERWVMGVVENCDGLIRNQYTGLKDKNEKEIYEGDIVKKYYKGQWVHLAIVWNPAGMWSVKWNDDYVNNFYLNYPSLEVIGNIYENPDLL